MDRLISKTKQRRATAQLFAAICGLAFWQGGLTFYAVVVVPVANSILSGGEQGFVTQEVTNWMHRLGLLVVVILTTTGWKLRSRKYWTACAALSITLAALFVIHVNMDALLDPVSRSIVDRDRFVLLHDLYLVVVTTQWCAALVAGWLLLSHQPVSDALAAR